MSHDYDTIDELDEVRLEYSPVKKRKLTVDERTIKNRERNKTHARKTRERKKNHMLAYAARIKELEEETTQLRSRVDARYTASVLLGMSSGSTDAETGTEIVSATTVCGRESVGMLEPGGVFANALADHNLDETVRRVRRRGKYTPQERETIRRERNRIHAKKTRDKKKVFLEASETMIRTLEEDVSKLRQYLQKCNLLSGQELVEMENKDRRAALNMASILDPLKSGSNALMKLYSQMEDGSSQPASSPGGQFTMMEALFKGVDERDRGSADTSRGQSGSASEVEEEGGEDEIYDKSNAPDQQTVFTTGSGHTSLSASSSSSDLMSIGREGSDQDKSPAFSRSRTSRSRSSSSSSSSGSGSGSSRSRSHPDSGASKSFPFAFAAQANFVIGNSGAEI